MSLLTKILGDPNKRELKKMNPLLEGINGLEKEFEKLTDAELKGKTNEFRERLRKPPSGSPLNKGGGESLDDLLVEAFAAVREAAKRTIGQRHYDVQLLAGITLHRGQVAEMKTGEGKTLAATLPLYLNALIGKGAHLITVNDYLAARDATWMGQVYHALGMSTGCIQQQGLSYLYSPLGKGGTKELSKQQQPPQAPPSKGEEETEKAKVQIDQERLKAVERKEAYAADITYGTNNEYGFDYLRDNMAQSLEQRVQRELNYTIVDEVDSILIDEARTPLIISAPASQATDTYFQFARIVPRLKADEDYNIDEKMRAATLTDEGINKVEKELGIENLYAEGGIRQVHHLENALRAHTLFKKDKDYVVKEGEVVIVDEFTGRLMFGRRYADGLHQAIEAKEGVKIQQESVTMATITFQNYFRLYHKLSGMTGTAKTEEEELAKIYGLSVLEIPTHQPIVRADEQDLIYKTEAGKFDAALKEIKARHELGQPVLVGTASIEKNEKLSELLGRAGLKHEVLNAKNHAREAQIIAQAGRVGAVTVATNMAGRGVDIVLGGNPPEADQVATVKRLGGLAVIGTERHESRRIDNQLRGRSGRQGDPGYSRFYISTEDDLMRIFGSDRIKNVLERLGVPDDMPIENKLISKSIESAQKKVEGHNFDTRKHLVEYDDVINRHRTVIYKMRDEILIGGSSSALEQRGAPSSPTVPSGSPSDAVLGHMPEPYVKPKGSGDSPSEHRDVPRSGTGEPARARGLPEPQPDENKNKILDMVAEEITSVVNFHTSAANEANWDINEIYQVVDTIFPLPLEVRLKMEDIYEAIAKQRGVENKKDLDDRQALTEYLINRSKVAYEQLEERFSPPDKEGNEGGSSPFPQLETAVLLRSIDTLWVEHIDTMDHLRQGIGLRGYGQRDPLVEYKREARTMFDSLLANIRRQVVYSIYKLGQLSQTGGHLPQKQQQNLQTSGAQKTMQAGAGFGQTVTSTLPQGQGAQSSTLGTQSAAVDRFTRKKQGAKQAPVTLQQAQGKLGRNDPCPCGAINPATNKPYKYKQCGLINAPHHKKT